MQCACWWCPSMTKAPEYHRAKRQIVRLTISPKTGYPFILGHRDPFYLKVLNVSTHYTSCKLCHVCVFLVDVTWSVYCVGYISGGSTWPA